MRYCSASTCPLPALWEQHPITCCGDPPAVGAHVVESILLGSCIIAFLLPSAHIHLGGLGVLQQLAQGPEAGRSRRLVPFTLRGRRLRF